MAVGVYVSQPAQVNRQLLANARSASHWFLPTASRPAVHSDVGNTSWTSPYPSPQVVGRAVGTTVGPRLGAAVGTLVQPEHVRLHSPK